MRPPVVSRIACHAGPAGLFCTQCSNSDVGIPALVRRLYSSRIWRFSEAVRGLRTMRKSSMDGDTFQQARLLIARNRCIEEFLECQPGFGVGPPIRGKLPKYIIDLAGHRERLYRVVPENRDTAPTHVPALRKDLLRNFRRRRAQLASLRFQSAVHKDERDFKKAMRTLAIEIIRREREARAIPKADCFRKAE